MSYVISRVVLRPSHEQLAVQTPTIHWASTCSFLPKHREDLQKLGL